MDSKRIDESIQKLIDMGLMYETKINNKVWIKLTDDGMKVVEEMMAMEAQ